VTGHLGSTHVTSAAESTSSWPSRELASRASWCGADRLRGRGSPPRRERELPPTRQTLRQEHENDGHEGGDGDEVGARADVEPAHAALLGVAEERVEPADHERADDRAE